MYCAKNVAEDYLFARYVPSPSGDNSFVWACFQNSTLNATVPGTCTFSDGTCFDCFPGPTASSVPKYANQDLQGTCGQRLSPGLVDANDCLSYHCPRFGVKREEVAHAFRPPPVGRRASDSRCIS